MEIKKYISHLQDVYKKKNVLYFLIDTRICMNYSMCLSRQYIVFFVYKSNILFRQIINYKRIFYEYFQRNITYELSYAGYNN